MEIHSQGREQISSRCVDWKRSSSSGKASPSARDQDIPRYQARDLFHVIRFEGMQNGFPQETIGLIPLTRPAMQS